MEDDHMKRPRTLVHEIELNQTRIAVLREDHARIGREISHLVAANKAKVMELVEAEVERLDLSQLPIHNLLSSLSKLGETVVVEHFFPTSLPEVEANIHAFVKLSRNASASNRRILESAGLHWHGRAGGWIGNVTPDDLAHLRLAFGERVEKPECGDRGDPAMPQERVPGVFSADVAAIAARAEEEQGQADTAIPERQSIATATATLRSSFGFPRRPT
jgi:hypothetical protein